ncbi:MAG: hypothetical protein A2428_09515 [Bdellovibrionales bacterium RIFOXYC1_FULL_54_43]|nr:MAG: hypothetical protein A2428_09515 [Bdellovibrionales bacterium RIFOXYC1_FULL_54_43]
MTILFVFLGAQSSGAASAEAPMPLPKLNPKKFTVCTATINSTEEKDAFQKALNPNEFEFIELTTLGKNPTSSAKPDYQESEAWIDRACQSGIRCDLVIISGHFGGTFFGSSGYRLPLNKLESHSCANDCTGILSHPREVFLFGCNTLATKSKDHRTPEEYVQVLVNDGFSRSEAERMAEGRYGAFGPENRDRMKRAFQKVPHLLGFDSVGPSGKTALPMVQKYLEAIPNYAEHLEKDATAQLVSGVISLNRYWETAMVGSAFAQCSGLLPTDPSYNDQSRICALYNVSSPVSDRIKIARDMLKSDRWMSFLPSVESFLTQYASNDLDEAGKAALSDLQNDAELKSKVLSAIEKLRAPVLKLEWTGFAHRMKWIEDERFNETARRAVLNTLKPPISRGTADILCSFPRGIKEAAKITPVDINETLYRSHNGLAAISCLKLGSHYIDVRKKIQQNITGNAPLKGDALMYALVVISEPLPNSDPDLEIKIEKQILKVLKNRAAKKELRQIAYWALRGTGMRTQGAIQMASDAALHSKEINIRNIAIAALADSKTLSQATVTALEALLFDPNDSIRNSAAQIFSKHPASRKTVLRVLERWFDPATQNACYECSWVLQAFKNPRPDDLIRLAALLDRPGFTNGYSIGAFLKQQESIPDVLLGKLVTTALDPTRYYQGAWQVVDILKRPEVAARLLLDPQIKKLLINAPEQSYWAAEVLANTRSVDPEIQAALAAKADYGNVDKSKLVTQVLIDAPQIAPEAERVLADALSRTWWPHDYGCWKILEEKGVKDVEAQKIIAKWINRCIGDPCDRAEALLKKSNPTDSEVLQLLETRVR